MINWQTYDAKYQIANFGQYCAYIVRIPTAEGVHVLIFDSDGQLVANETFNDEKTARAYAEASMKTTSRQSSSPNDSSRAP